MCGGIDRSTFPELKAGDEKFISDVTAQFGSRERASALWVNYGFKLLKQNNYGMATRRFDQAWLLDPTNAEVYWGFSTVLHDRDRGEECEAMRMMDKTLTLNPATYQGIYPDAGQIVTLCAIRDKTLSPEHASKENG